MNLSRLFKTLIVSVPFLFSLHLPAQEKTNWDMSTLQSVPVQSGGRIKPLDSFARDQVLFITGKSSFNSWSSIELLLSWMTDPKSWSTQSFILLQNKEAKRQIGVDESQSRFSPEILFEKSHLSQYASELGQESSKLAAPIEKTSKADPREQDLKRLMERIHTHQMLLSGEGWLVLPSKDDWKPLLSGSSSQGEGHSSEIQSAYLKVFSSYLKKDETSFQEASQLLKKLVSEQIPSWTPSDESKLNYELQYNRLHPFGLAWKIYALAAILWGIILLFGRFKNSNSLTRVAHGFLIIGFGIHIYGFILRCLVAGRPPVTNMYESIVWVCLGVVFFAYVIYFLQKNQMILLVASVIGTLGLIISDAAPAMIDPGIHPLVPVLRSNYWLTIHVLTITLSYATLALSWGLSNVTLFQYLRRKDLTESGMLKINSLNLLSYRSIQIGVVLLAAGTILGGIWADYSWGRFWGWDPKEVWALIALMGYLVILHARYTGWMKAYGFAAWTIVSFALVVMAWYGVNFVLGVGLHSYGFSQGGQGVVASLMLVQIIYVVLVSLIRRVSTKS